MDTAVPVAFEGWILAVPSVLAKGKVFHGDAPFTCSNRDLPRLPLCVRIVDVWRRSLVVWPIFALKQAMP